MATKRRVTRYDIGADSATRPDIVTPVSDEHDDWGHVEVLPPRAEVLPPRWSEATVPDLPLRISMAAPPPERAPPNTAAPRSGTRHRAPSTPARPPTLAELAADRGSSPPPVRSEPAPARVVTARPARARGSTWLPMAVAVTGIAAALGAAVGNTDFARELTAPSSGPPPVTSAYVVPPRATALLHPRPSPMPRPTARAIPEVRYEDLPLLPSETPDTPDGGAHRRRFRGRAR